VACSSSTAGPVGACAASSATRSSPSSAARFAWSRGWVGQPIGVTGLLCALVLAATSSDWALRRLGATAWKWLHHSALFVFYLSLLHVGYFLFIHYTLSFHKQVPPPDWFRLPFLLLGATVLGLQAAAFVHTTRRRPAPVRAPRSGRSS